MATQGTNGNCAGFTWEFRFLCFFWQTLKNRAFLSVVVDTLCGYHFSSTKGQRTFGVQATLALICELLAKHKALRGKQKISEQKIYFLFFSDCSKNNPPEKTDKSPQHSYSQLALGNK